MRVSELQTLALIKRKRSEQYPEGFAPEAVRRAMQKNARENSFASRILGPRSNPGKDFELMFGPFGANRFDFSDTYPLQLIVLIHG